MLIFVTVFLVIRMNEFFFLFETVHLFQILLSNRLPLLQTNHVASLQKIAQGMRIVIIESCATEDRDGGATTEGHVAFLPRPFWLNYG